MTTDLINCNIQICNNVDTLICELTYDGTTYISNITQNDLHSGCLRLQQLEKIIISNAKETKPNYSFLIEQTQNTITMKKNLILSIKFSDDLIEFDETIIFREKVLSETINDEINRLREFIIKQQDTLQLSLKNKDDEINQLKDFVTHQVNTLKSSIKYKDDEISQLESVVLDLQDTLKLSQKNKDDEINQLKTVIMDLQKQISGIHDIFVDTLIKNTGHVHTNNIIINNDIMKDRRLLKHIESQIRQDSLGSSGCTVAWFQQAIYAANVDFAKYIKSLDKDGFINIRADISTKKTWFLGSQNVGSYYYNVDMERWLKDEFPNVFNQLEASQIFSLLGSSTSFEVFEYYESVLPKIDYNHTFGVAVNNCNMEMIKYLCERSDIRKKLDFQKHMVNNSYIAQYPHINAKIIEYYHTIKKKYSIV